MTQVPALLALWNPDRNSEPADNTPSGTSRRAWWRCPRVPAHEWHASVGSVHAAVRAGNTGCPFCRGLRADATNSVAALLPALAAQWNRERNAQAPEEVVAGSNRKVWWRCPAGPDHAWHASPDSRSKSPGCPFCAGRRVSVTNRLDTLHPEVAAQWHPTRNPGRTPESTVSGSHLRTWWRCPVDPAHEWETTVLQRTRVQAGCPYCSGRLATAEENLAVRWPEVVSLWDGRRNEGLRPDQVRPVSDREVWWACPAADDHRWRAAVKTVVAAHRRGRRGCPMCSGRQASVTNSVASHPTLAAEWHPTRNLPATAEGTVAGTAEHLWWRCTVDPEHEWEATGANRNRDRGCPWCKPHKRGTLETCLAFELQTLFPDLDPAADKVRVGPRELLAVDILLPAAKVAVEVDGWYRHQDREDRDARKNERLREAGWRVLRVREDPLGPVDPAVDVLVRSEPGVKETADAVLRRLADLGWARPSGLDAYLAEPAARREDEALAALAAERGAKVRRPGRERGPDLVTLWDSRLALLARYAAREGAATPPESHVEDGVRLGAWAAQQRLLRRRGRLDPTRAARLEALPGWSWNPVADAFNRRLALLLRVVERTGSAYVPVNHVEDGVALGGWVRGMQSNRTRATDGQRQALDGLPGWSWDRAGYVRTGAGSA